MAIDKFKLPKWASPKPETKKRPYVNKKLVKQLHGNRCKICGRTEEEVGKLQMAHYKAHSKDGNLIFPLCANDHGRYDQGSLKTSELKKLNLTKKQYEKFRPSKTKPKKKENTGFGAGIDYSKF